MEDRRRQDLVIEELLLGRCRNHGFNLSQAERMSFRNDDSCRIDDPGVPEDCRAHPWLQATSGNQVDPAPRERL